MAYLFGIYFFALVCTFFEKRRLALLLIALNLILSFLMLLEYTTDIHLW
jgi:hypothetical protein